MLNLNDISSTSFFVVVNDEGHIIHSSTDPGHVPLMQKYVANALAAGDNWKLHEFKFARTIPCSKENR